MSFKSFKEEISDLLEVPFEEIMKLFCGCNYLGEAIQSEYEDEKFKVSYCLVEIDEDDILEYANNHENLDYDLHDNDDIVIKEEGTIYSKQTGKSVEYVLNIHRSVVQEDDGNWLFSGTISLDYCNVKLLEEQN